MEPSLARLTLRSDHTSYSQHTRISADSLRLKELPVTPIVVSYDRECYGYERLVAEMLAVENLSCIDGFADGLLNAGADQDTIFHQRFYHTISQFLPTYHRFLNEFVAPIFPEPFCYQRIPTFRVHLQHNVAVGEFHLDSDYNHQWGEVNFWVPITECWGTNSIWIESAPKANDFLPIRLSPGELLVFDANSLRHGNRINETGATRLSFDFRCIPLSRYVDAGLCSVAYGQALRIGEYFALFPPGGLER